MNQEQPEKAAYQHGEYNLRPERIRPLFHLQRAVAQRDIELHPEIAEKEWVEAHANDYRIFVDKHDEFLDRYEEASNISDPAKKKKAIELLVDEIRQQISN